MFPILNQRGETVAFGGRVMGEGQPKYLNSPETMLFSKSRILYALNFAGPAIRKENRAILLEGYMDVIACHQAGVENCVAPLGTSFTPEHAKLLKRYASDVVVMFDPDNAGIKATTKAVITLIENGLDIHVAALPEGLDPDEYITKYGAGTFKNIVTNAKDIINFQADILFKTRGTLNPQEKTIAIAEFVEIIQKQSNEIIKREWALAAADRLKVDWDIIISKVSPQTAKKRTDLGGQPAILHDIPRAETDLIKMLLKFPKYCDLCEDLQEYHFQNKALWKILSSIKNFSMQLPVENIAAALVKELPQEENLILKLSLEQIPQNTHPSADIKAITKTIQKFALKDLLKRLQDKEKQYPAGEVPLDLLKEEIELQKKIKS
jgi:DNA primase